MLLCIVSFLSGALVLGIVQLLVLLYYLRRLLRNQRHGAFQVPQVSNETNHYQTFPVSHQGIIWVATISPETLEKAAASKVGQRQKSQNETKLKKDETKKGLIAPLQNHAKLHDGNLILTSLDGTERFISLEGCDVKAVSGAPLASKKWAKKYPIKLQHDTRPLLAGSTICLLYLETSWEKEAWCEVLRVAARQENYANGWYTELKKEFKDYVKVIKDQYPSIKTAKFLSLVLDGKSETNKSEAVSAKKLFWKKLLKKTSKSIGRETKPSERIGDAIQPRPLVGPLNDHQPPEAAGISAHLQRCSSWHNGDFQKNTLSPDDEARHDALHEFFGDSFPGRYSLASDSVTTKDAPSRFKDTENSLSEKNVSDGVLGWNILFSRIFFDLYHSSAIVASLQSRIQKLLSKVETPSYVSKISCTHLDLGKAPPIIEGMRILPFDSDGVWGLEADIDYSGGAVLTIETRLNIRDSSLQEKAVNQGLESSLVDAATIGLLKNGPQLVDDGFEIVGELDVDQAGQTNEGGTNVVASYKSGNNNASKISNRKRWVQSVAGWKSVLSHVAEQVSQVPLVLSLKILSLKGTLQIRIKAPPSDRVWVGFASMPVLEFASEPSIGDRKISPGPLIAFITERIKMLIRETLVLPHFEDFYIPWMISDKDDWLEQSLVPIPWSPLHLNESAQIEDSRRGCQSNINFDQDKGKAPDSYSDDQLFSKKPSSSTAKLSSSAMTASASSAEQKPVGQRAFPKDCSSDLERPLLMDGEKHAETATSEQDSPRLQHSEKGDCLVNLGSKNGESSGIPFQADDASKQNERRESRRVKMMSLGKRMGEKFEEKTRHLAEKMRERFEN
ncbi:hypothetical protein O6H91_21G016200 [Diphasiastrum complanatum]|uniref:Uncharacterized protein n=4 Tax=Diphasiastrum complanatum TaxID=34168 RepID=A0ACC2AID6_DIPCM|nr:hypothetical protein O6H91_21G016200 [Diphasiastrum complanatum]KAJ7517258.1 hypothetical protein O6H91_21G016200 [Diphasiastrum complanatum]KAJ7517259.1 hypothetical protein O6H91_21G016200 [Diphasiastrum complanatum]KAJ7517261.1 hypothetical protein O6H91_21G016200 [Diphasiastrum complanatum]